MQDLVLHHYWGSPYAEKIRLLLGYKSLRWQSLEIAPVPPREGLSAVLGAFRRTPVLQLGADFFCDTRLIAHVIDRLRSDPPLDTGCNQALSTAICGWIEPRAFVLTGPIRFQTAEDVAGVFDGAVHPAAFQADRFPFMQPVLQQSRFAALRPSARDHLLAYLQLIELTLSDGHEYIGGSQPTFADFSAYHLIWWLRHPPSHASLLRDFPHIDLWANRMMAIGHGQYSQVQTRQSNEAVHAGQAASHWQSPWPARADERLGKLVTVIADDYGRDPVQGMLVDSSDRHITVRRSAGSLGTVHVHFPRLGYEIAAESY
jgi:glutathione S-transferase